MGSILGEVGTQRGRLVFVPKPIHWEGWVLAGCFKVFLRPVETHSHCHVLLVDGGTQGGFGLEPTWPPWSSPMGNICAFILAPWLTVVLRFSSNAHIGVLLVLVVPGSSCLLLWSFHGVVSLAKSFLDFGGTRTLYLSSMLSWCLPIALGFSWGTARRAGS